MNNLHALLIEKNGQFIITALNTFSHIIARNQFSPSMLHNVDILDEHGTSLMPTTININTLTECKMILALQIPAKNRMKKLMIGIDKPPSIIKLCESNIIWDDANKLTVRLTSEKQNHVAQILTYS